MNILVLASTSPFRQQILHKLNIDFVVDSPDISEEALENESPVELVKRLSKLKAMAVANHHPQALIIGSDQVAVLDREILGKPHSHENAVKQLAAASAPLKNHK
jgi:septum formation protein